MHIETPSQFDAFVGNGYGERSQDFKNPHTSNIIRKIIAEGMNVFSSYATFSDTPLSPAALLADKLSGTSYRLEPIEGTIFQVSNDTDRVIFHRNAPDLFPALRRISTNQQLVRKILATAKIPLPLGRFFSDEEEALNYFLNRKTPQSVKPRDGNRVDRHTGNVESEDAFRAAWKKAYVAGRMVLVEDMVLGHALRIFVVNGKTEAAFVLLPANVVGDGQKTITELIAENKASRAHNPFLKFYQVKASSRIARAGRFASYVPKAGEWIFLSKFAALETGAEVASLREKLHPSLVVLAESAAKAIPNATFLSISMTVKDLQKGVFEDSNATVTGIDCNAPIAMACFPSYGTVEEGFVHRLIDAAFEAAAHTRAIKERVTKAHIAPADIHYAPCNGNSFNRDYSTQRRLIRQAAYARNLQVQSISRDIIIVSNGSETATFVDGMPHLTRVVCRTATNDKEWTKKLLREAGLSAPAGGMFDAWQGEKAWAFAQTLRMPVVVKPRAGSGGKGITTDISTEEHFMQAWCEAVKTNVKKILVEEFYAGNDYRVFVVGNQVRAVSQRLPAYIVGDGVHTIDELIDLKNIKRAASPYDGSKLMRLTPMMLRNIASLSFTTKTVLEDGYHLQLHKVANIGSGGESQDLSSEIHPDWAEISAKVRRSVFDPLHVGFDLIAEDVRLSPHDQRWVIIEVNTNPDMGIHHFVTHGEPRNSSIALIDALFPETLLETQKKAVRVQAKELPEDKDISQLIWRAAHLRSVAGMVKKQGQSYEAIFAGTPSAVDDMVKKFCRAISIKKSNIEVMDYAGDLPRGFEIR